jgi:hypothetical protein
MNVTATLTATSAANHARHAPQPPPRQARRRLTWVIADAAHCGERLRSPASSPAGVGRGFDAERHAWLRAGCCRLTVWPRSLRPARSVLYLCPVFAASCCPVRQFLRWRLGTPGLSVRKPVDDLCKHPKNLCATWGKRWGFPRGRACGRARYLGEHYARPVYGRKPESVHTNRRNGS